MLEAMWVTVVQ